MNRKTILASLLVCAIVTTQAQNNKTEEPKGKALMQVFGNFHTGFGSKF